MARTPSQTPAEAIDAAQRLIGFNRPHGTERITSDTRAAVRAWLVAEGIPSSYVQTLSLETLRGVWADASNGTLSLMRAAARKAPPDLIMPKDADEQPAQDENGQDDLLTPAQQPGRPAQAKTDPQAAADALAKAMAMIAGLGGNQQSELDEPRVISLIKKHAPKLESSLCRIEIKLPNRPELKEDAKPRHEAFEEILGAVADGLNVLIVGPAGSGKTHLAEQVAQTLGLSFAFTGAIASEYKLLGFMNAQGNYVTTAYRKAYENGWLYLWDEMDASAPAALLPFNAGLANGHQDFPDEVVKRHENFRCIASANTYGNGADRVYVGRNQLDAASLDRFYVVPMDYDEKLERTLFGDDEWTNYVHKARRAVRALNMRHVISMRAIDMGQKRLASGADRKQVERAVLWKHLSGADIAKVKGAM